MNLMPENLVNTGVIVPTMGTRSELLLTCLSSIREAGQSFIMLVAPTSFDHTPLFDAGLIDAVYPDPKLGLADAINQGIKNLPAEIKYATWLGDDDLLNPGVLTECEHFLNRYSSTVMVYGDCRYIDHEGRTIWENSFGKFAAKILRIGPCLIPQPGSLFRRNVFQQINGLDTQYGWAFDFDLFIRLSKVGRIEYMSKELAAFRWHSDSLTVRQRKASVREASMVRRRNQTLMVRMVLSPLEPLIRFATLYGPVIFKKTS